MFEVFVSFVSSEVLNIEKDGLTVVSPLVVKIGFDAFGIIDRKSGA